MILAIDPGSIESAYVLIDEKLKPVEFGKEDNKTVLEIVEANPYKHFAIEMVACYGMPVGKDVFETAFWIGRFWEVSESCSLFHVNPVYAKKIYRKSDVCMNLCHTTKAKDSNIIQALVDRFAPGQKHKGKGTKKSPGWFYGFKADIWQAYAVGITYYDMYLRKEE